MPNNTVVNEESFTQILGTISERLKTFVDGVATLEVYTVVTDFQITISTPAKSTKPDITMKNMDGNITPANGAYSAINALTGDIKTIWSPKLDPLAHAALLEAHNANVSLSREIFQKNVKMVGDLIREFLPSS